jgi:hypothetical protein
MPGIAPHPITRIAQCLVLQPLGVQPGRASVDDQKLAAAGHKVRHRMPGPHMAVQPKTAGHRMDHSLATVRELTPEDR